jgi:hypothetical protein
MTVCGWCGETTTENPCWKCGRDPLYFWKHLRKDVQTGVIGPSNAVVAGTPAATSELYAVGDLYLTTRRATRRASRLRNVAGVGRRPGPDRG